MTQDIDNTGPAFPQPCTEGGHAANSPFGIAGGGLTKREWFAGMALQGELASQGSYTGSYTPEDFSALSEYCYDIADAMIEEGKKK